FTYNGDKQEAIEEAISFAIYRLMVNRFINSPGAGIIFSLITDKMNNMGYDPSFSSIDYTTGEPAALGNYIAQHIISFGYQDGSNQLMDYANEYYEPVNEPLLVEFPGAGTLNDPNRWQPLTLQIFIDQSGNVIPFNTPDFLSPEWGNVTPFALTDDDLTIHTRDGDDYWVYHDPGDPPYLSLTENNESSEQFKWGFSMVSVWGSHLDPANTKTIDISPASLGNINDLPTDYADYPSFYDFFDGGDASKGHESNPFTGQPYEPNLVKLSDYARVLAEFWADGPDSETPPGHWFTILNYVNDHPELQRKYRGTGEILDPLEWDVKAYFLLGGAMHDCAVSSWGIKGWYDYLRPISAIRSMADRGQSSDPSLPNYDIGGIPLIPGYIELVTADDPLADQDVNNINKIKLYTWKGPEFINNPDTDIAGVDWILAEKWWPYQRPSFVSPPFAGFVSGHSTYSRAAADVLTFFTGSAFFPGGMGEFIAEKNEFLVFEDGPSEDIVLQWATYRDASDQTSLSRIWGGIHPPQDDIPGRLIGVEIAKDAISKSEIFFFNDNDEDGFYNYQDCDDENPEINPDASETCDGIDNNCSGEIDENLTIYRYYLDEDNDGFGNSSFPLDTCLEIPPAGFIDNDSDCNDSMSSINPVSQEVCDGIDNNCSGLIDDGLPLNSYYFDADNDGFGNINIKIDTCISVPPAGYVSDNSDCNDNVNEINPQVNEICDAIDNDCDGILNNGLTRYTYYFDFDNDGFGDVNMVLDTCISLPPAGFVTDSTDCNDNEASIYPGAEEISDNDIDEDCNGIDLYRITKVFPNPTNEYIRVHFDYSAPVNVRIYDTGGKLVKTQLIGPLENYFLVYLNELNPGLYIFHLSDEDNNELHSQTILKY
ncbi:MAG: T9SS type A sorting domain-containing protein, partial [Saprospiraceae bacterium]|nr:T9SS type A sorting domain-containing protein [Saprospiraceae bacterium]